MKDKTKRLKAVIGIISVFPLIITALYTRNLPDSVPMHFDSDGNINRWGAKSEFWVLAVLLGLVCLSWIAIAASFTGKAKDADNDKAQAEARKNEEVMLTTGIIMSLFFSTIQFTSIHSAIEAMENGNKLPVAEFYIVTNITLSLIVIVLGNAIPKTRKNSVIGLRISWSMYNDNTWVKSQRAGGIIMIIAGGISLIISVLIRTWVSTLIIVCILIVMSVACCIAAYKIYNKEITDEARRH